MNRWSVLVFLGALAFAGCATSQTPRRDRPPDERTGARPNRPRGQDRPRGNNRPRNRQDNRSGASETPLEIPGALPLTDMVHENGSVATYLGFEGGLYFGQNEMPSAHASFGASAARQIQPLNAAGSPDANGAIVLMSISMSNATREWCHKTSSGAPNDEPCERQTFMGQASTDPSLNDNLVIVNGAKGTKALESWDSADDEEYDRLASEVLPAYGLTEAQVQVIWLETALRDEPTRPSLPSSNADAYELEATIGRMMRALNTRYPNLQQVFLTSRSFGGFARADSHSPEPWAYETGFATKWAIEAQISERATGVVDRETGPVADVPFMSWGPYIWSYGTHPREDGLIWTRDLFINDGMHPSEAGQRVVANYLLDFFRTSPITRCWFLAGLACV